jgi:hypothetical protein
MLSNAYFLAKIRFDTAENEPAQNLQIFAKFAHFLLPRRPRRQPGSWRRKAHGSLQPPAVNVVSGDAFETGSAWKAVGAACSGFSPLENLFQAAPL